MQFNLKTLGFVLAGLVAAADALPGSYWRTRGTSGIKVTGCETTKAVIPLMDTTPSLSPPSSSYPVRVVLGKGTQNYTCAGAPTDAPAAVGAKAQLYDVSCLAQSHPAFLHALPGALLEFGTTIELFLAKEISEMERRNINVGHHIFSKPGTPVFDFRRNGVRDIFVGTKLENVPAPATAKKGDNGAVDWLKIGAIGGTIGFTEAYRVMTAGGKAPETCEGMPAAFEIPYVAEYWFYN